MRTPSSASSSTRLTWGSGRRASDRGVTGRCQRPRSAPIVPIAARMNPSSHGVPGYRGFGNWGDGDVDD